MNSSSGSGADGILLVNAEKPVIGLPSSHSRFMIKHVQFLASELSLRESQVENALQLLEEGGTVPFIARYRKERTGEMNEIQLRTLFDRYAYIREIEERKQTILKSIKEQGKLTDELRALVNGCTQKSALEDLYLPYKPRKRTRATVARERGLEPLADFIKSKNAPVFTAVDLDAEASKYISIEKGVPTAQEALAGAADILAEEVSQKAEIRSFLRDHILKDGVIVSSIVEKYPPGTTKYEMYRDFKVPVGEIQPHNLLALLRGERENVLRFEITVNEEIVHRHLESNELFAASPPVKEFYRSMLREAFGRLLRTPLTGEVRSLRKEYADSESIKTFEANLRELLLSSPAGMRPTLGIDPGIRTGCKVVVIDNTGKFIEHTALFPHRSAAERQDAHRKLAGLITKYDIELVAIGNGTGGRETDEFVGEVAETLERKPVKVIVSESGASVYSASEVARGEFPDLDITVRGAISIGRRLQDPLAEIVKIDPKSIGVGQYQHDVDQRLLKKQLEETIESCVNYVGVDVNTASKELLRYVAGINSAQARNIVLFRYENGPFASREQLRVVPKLGPKSFEQAAGFLRIRNGGNPLDNSAVHPESYPIAEKMLKDTGLSMADVPQHPEKLRNIDISKYVTGSAGEPTLRDIVAELQRPGRDPRKEFRYATFKEGVKEIKDLKPGMELEGVVTNVANFGAFVDIGVHQDGLVHVSQIADRYIADPKAVVKVGQIVRVRVLEVNESLKRISLTMKSLQGKVPRPARHRKSPPEERGRFTLDDLKTKFNSR